MRPLFVYGTLRDAEVLELVIGHRVAPDQRRGARAPGHAAVFFPGRTYPAIVARRAAEAAGTLLGGLGPSDLEALDRFEGEEYRRGAIELIVSGEPVGADVYWPAQAIPADAPLWRLEQWVERHKAAFLAAEARNIAGLRQHLSGLR